MTTEGVVITLRYMWRGVVLLTVLGALVLLSVGASAHVTRIIGADQYLVIVGFTVEPPYTDERNGLDLMIRSAADGEPVANLEETLFAEIIAPDGVAKRTLPVRAVFGKPGAYTADVVLTEPGVYQFRVWGYVRTVKFDETFPTSPVEPWASLRFPGQ